MLDTVREVSVCQCVINVYELYEYDLHILQYTVYFSRTIYYRTHQNMALRHLYSNLVTIKHGPALWSSHLILVQRAPP